METFWKACVALGLLGNLLQVSVSVLLKAHHDVQYNVLRVAHSTPREISPPKDVLVQMPSTSG
jgi:hypothetical protein